MRKEFLSTKHADDKVIDLGGLIKQFKESLARRLWALPTVSESEKEVVFKEYLSDLDTLEQNLDAFVERHDHSLKSNQDENELLRSLLGVSDDELRAKVLTLEQDVIYHKEKKAEADEELTQLRDQLFEKNKENENLRRQLLTLEKKNEVAQVGFVQDQEKYIREYTEKNESLKNSLRDLEARLQALRELFVTSNETLIREKQEEVTLLQKNILKEMEDTIQEKQRLFWAEEELFSKGVANRLRTALVSAQGQLLLTAERVGLFDAESKTESVWKMRFKLFMEGANELRNNILIIQKQLEDITKALDDYFQLTNRNELKNESVSIVELIRHELALFTIERIPTLSIQFSFDDVVPDVRGDHEVLAYVFRSLLQNARESLPNQSGQITSYVRFDSKKSMVECHISDTGCGIPSEFTEKLFQPFFTTKSGRQGLSLSRSRKFIEWHGGSMSLVSTSSAGTKFVVALPIKRAQS